MFTFFFFYPHESLSTWLHVHNSIYSFVHKNHLVNMSPRPKSFFFFFGEVLVTRIHVHVLLYQNIEVCPHLDIHIHIFYIQVIYIIVKIYKIHIWKWMLKCGEKKLQFIVTTVFVLYIWKMRKNTKNKRLNE